MRIRQQGLRGDAFGRSGRGLDALEESMHTAVPAPERRLDPLHLAGWLCVGLLAALLLLSAWQGPDIFGHIYLGERVLETGKAQPADNLILKQPSYVNVYWMFQVTVAAVYRFGGVVGVTLLFLGLWLAILALFVRFSAADRHPAGGVPFVAGAVLVLANRFDPRPEVLSYLLLMLQLVWLTTWDFRQSLSWRKLACFGGVQVLWSNAHLFFVFGPVLVGLRLLASLLDRSDRDRAPRNLALLLGVTLLATLISPLAFRNWGYVATAWNFVRAMHGGIVEFRSPATLLRLWSIKLFWVYWAGTLVAAAVMLARKRLTPFAALTMLLGLYLSASTVRNIPLLLLMGAPVWRCVFGAGASSVSSRSPKVKPPQTSVARLRERGVVVGAGVACLVLAGWVVTGGYYRSLALPSRFGLALQPAAFPIYFERYLGDSGFEGKIFNSSFDGAYLEHRFPGVQFYTDPRYVEAGPVREYFAALRHPEPFARLHSRIGFDGVLLQVLESGQLTAALMGSPNWRLVYADPHRAFFVARTSAAGQALPVAPPRFYLGDDLSERANGITAIQWMHVLVAAQARDLLLEALRQLAQAGAVPSPAVEFGLRFGLDKNDDEVLQAAAALYPKIITLGPEERAAINHLMQAARGRAASGVR